MILGTVSLLDCLVFVLFLTPQLVLQAGLFPTAETVLRALPFLLVTLPTDLARTRTRPRSWFQDVVLRCVRWAFVNMPPRVGRVFFTRRVVVPFLRFRLLRHGHWRGFHADVRELMQGDGLDRFTGVWIRKDPNKDPDIVVYYIHGKHPPPTHTHRNAASC